MQPRNIDSKTRVNQALQNLPRNYIFMAHSEEFRKFADEARNRTNNNINKASGTGKFPFESLDVFLKEINESPDWKKQNIYHVIEIGFRKLIGFTLKDLQLDEFEHQQIYEKKIRNCKKEKTDDFFRFIDHVKKSAHAGNIAAAFWMVSFHMRNFREADICLSMNDLICYAEGYVAYLEEGYLSDSHFHNIEAACFATSFVMMMTAFVENIEEKKNIERREMKKLIDAFKSNSSFVPRIGQAFLMQIENLCGLIKRTTNKGNLTSLTYSLKLLVADIVVEAKKMPQEQGCGIRRDALAYLKLREKASVIRNNASVLFQEHNSESSLLSKIPPELVAKICAHSGDAKEDEMDGAIGLALENFNF
jgi:hypothetical protein